jgi:DNA polymerase III alpha subunit
MTLKYLPGEAVYSLSTPFTTVDTQGSPILYFFLSKGSSYQFYERKIKASGRKIVTANQLHEYVGRRVNLAAWSTTGTEVRIYNGAPMEFVSFEDETAIFETVFFARRRNASARFCI